MSAKNRKREGNMCESVEERKKTSEKGKYIKEKKVRDRKKKGRENGSRKGSKGEREI
jgi:hypothetical protein